MPIHPRDILPWLSGASDKGEAAMSGEEADSVAHTARPMTAKGWTLLSSSEVTPLKLEAPKTTMALSGAEAAWFRKIHVETAKRSAAARAGTTSRSPRARKPAAS
jgi:hypothetical protein